MQSISSDVL